MTALDLDTAIAQNTAALRRLMAERDVLRFEPVTVVEHRPEWTLSLGVKAWMPTPEDVVASLYVYWFRPGATTEEVRNGTTIVPSTVGDWATHTPDSLILRRRAFWLCLHGQPATTNATNVTVTIPIANAFTKETLTEMMNRVGQGGQP